VGKAASLASVVEPDGVGHSNFKTGSEDGLQLVEVPSVMEVIPDWAAFRVVLPLSSIICNLIGSDDGKVFLPSFKSTERG
jgi:hypothetical protein